ncbi:MAG: hypothetical protein K2X93_28185 [Candidatus Obscuribacterales bacterium]|nr:hypothetical protein [Candidatus Obscuribacterales bacterium]
MRFDRYGEIEIFRPRSSTERVVLAEEEQALRSSMKPGLYESADDINKAIKALCLFYGEKLEANLPKLASRHYVEFLQWQYDQSFEVEMNYRRGSLTNDEQKQWSELGRVFRRALKHLIERVCSLEPGSEPELDGEDLLWTTEVVQVCAEEFVSLCILSESTFAIFPDETKLTIYPEGEGKLYLLEVLNKKALSMDERLKIDGNNRRRWVAGKTIDRDLDEQGGYLDSAFLESHGISYVDAIGLLGHLVDSVEPSEGSFKSRFSHKSELLKVFQENLNVSAEVLEKVLSGFTITAQHLQEDPSTIWNPKRQHRAYRRALFEMPHSNGLCLAWSRAMAHEALETLVQSAVFQQFPEEWRTEKMQQALAELDNQRGKWFERCTVTILTSLGFIGFASVKNTLGKGPKVQIPDDVGELDFLAYVPSERRLVLIECKMTQWTSEPKLWRADLKRFLDKDKGYADKFRKKRDWVLANKDEVIGVLSSELKLPVEPGMMSCAMVTFSPNIASCFIDDFPCVSLAELIVDFEKEGSKWPYVVGGSKIEA